MSRGFGKGDGSGWWGWWGDDDDEHADGEPLFDGHDADNGNLHLTIPELAGARTIAAASVSGSPTVRRQARIMAWVLLVFLVGPVVLMVVRQILDRL